VHGAGACIMVLFASSEIYFLYFAIDSRLYRMSRTYSATTQKPISNAQARGIVRRFSPSEEWLTLLSVDETSGIGSWELIVVIAQSLGYKQTLSLHPKSNGQGCMILTCQCISSPATRRVSTQKSRSGRGSMPALTGNGLCTIVSQSQGCL
jgi:hypothetical protein